MGDADKSRGLYQKYIVERSDGSKPEGAKYFVLRYDKDIHAMTALEAYMILVERDYPELAADLHRELENLGYFCIGD